jgi:hypothetical protein
MYTFEQSRIRFLTPFFLTDQTYGAFVVGHALTPVIALPRQRTFSVSPLAVCSTRRTPSPFLLSLVVSELVKVAKVLITNLFTRDILSAKATSVKLG